MVETRRLHVSPLDLELLPIVLSGPLRDLASNISFHTLQSFPEKSYGYFDLPVLEADRLQKKLHGSILRGVKMKVEKARPEKPRLIEDTQDGEGNKTDSKRIRKPKSVRKDGVLEGVELPNGRKVKRGWTDSGTEAEKKSTKQDKRGNKAGLQKASAHTNSPECLFKTKIPSNASAIITQNAASATKQKKRKRGESERDVLVHEFDKTTKQATFLRDDKDSIGKKSTSSYIEGKGWIDQDGNIIEKVDGGRTTRRKARELAGNSEDSTTGHVQGAKESKPLAGRSKKPGTDGKRVSTMNGTEKLKERKGISALQSPEPSHNAGAALDDQTSSEGSDSSEERDK
ncbi:MAG: hypothetical protein Q9198_008143, partial [Flavoplaca austrocitrina]